MGGGEGCAELLKVAATVEGRFNVLVWLPLLTYTVHINHTLLAARKQAAVACMKAKPDRAIYNNRLGLRGGVSDRVTECGTSSTGCTPDDDDDDRDYILCIVVE